MAIAAAAILRAQVQQLYDRFEMENLEVNGAEVVFKEDPKELEDQEEIQIDDGIKFNSALKLFNNVQITPL